MLQEIITYLIVAGALLYAVSKFTKRFWRKKTQAKKVGFKTGKVSMKQNCSDCAADCMLRDAAKEARGKNADLCRKTEVKNPGL